MSNLFGIGSVILRTCAIEQFFGRSKAISPAKALLHVTNLKYSGFRIHNHPNWVLSNLLQCLKIRCSKNPVVGNLIVPPSKLQRSPISVPLKAFPPVKQSQPGAECRSFTIKPIRTTTQYKHDCCKSCNLDYLIFISISISIPIPIPIPLHYIALHMYVYIYIGPINQLQ